MLDFDLFPISDQKQIDNQWVGKCQKGILVLAGEEIAQEANRAFLQKVLSAIQVDLDNDAALLLVAPGDQHRFAGIPAQFAIKQVISFGVPLTQLGIQAALSPYQPAPIGNCKFLLAEPLALIRESREKGDNRRAGALWKALQSLM
ncbi:MAG: hypothetical protein JNK77_01600 [Saprospiraceae bacterium]|nr:hypothetical protein [Saprospiraceae bacterium]